MVPLVENGFKEKFESVKDLILNEVNVKDVEYISDTSGILVKKVKPNFKTLGPKYGKMMKAISAVVDKMSQADIVAFEQKGNFNVQIEEEAISLGMEDLDVISEDIPGWLVANEGKITIALDISISSELRQEGIAREFINRIQNLRKDSGFDVTDKIVIDIQKNDAINSAVLNYKDYIGSQTLANKIELVESLSDDSREVEIDENIITRLKISKVV
jgi:isoleucyl-tRNA synthetase